MLRGRPLRFLALTLAGWTGARVAMMWPGAAELPLPALIRVIAPPLLAAEPQGAVVAAMPPPSRPVKRATARRTAVASAAPVIPSARRHRAPDPVRIALALAGLVRYGPAIADEPVDLPPPLRPTPIATGPSRWSGSAWGIARGGAQPRLLTSQLGGSQAGARVAYAIDERRRLAIVGRLATAIEQRGTDGAVGVEWRLAPAVRVVAEQRIGIDRAAGGATLGIVAGVDHVAMPGGWRLDAYGQAGAIARDGGVAYADGATRVTRPIAAGIDVGGGAWGGAQPGAARLDIGPTLAVALPVAGQRWRVSFDWRQRIAGDAAPGSGPALSIGTDF